MARTLFLTGTGTDIGKTVSSMAVLLWARARGLKAAYLKPVQCGSRDDAPAGTFVGDADWLQTALGDDLPEAGSIYSFADPVSPHLAAERAGAWIDPEWLVSQAELMARRCDLLVIEGAGGSAVPLNRDGLCLADIAASAGWPCLVMASPGLGTLHHTLTTLHFLASRGASVTGFGFVQNTPEVSPLKADNAATLAALSGKPFFGMVPYCPGLGRRPSVSPAVASLLAESLPGLDAWWGEGPAA